ncbi:GNAT family N-acetyltransferase [Microbacterium paludicola]|uniref:GNAT family N-acetyltransferase n=1 Tax=Microbacterium paludicola TaxID=300019 RepID=A0A4Y9FXY5_9MICO|nr:GNAT family N-acetyltransferase [Microbacterium paludicola]MBF0815051.1 GNAT family N-acetyltransferase [Microbacterium paludicola]TFU34327.1 GNAT family N-acetyltransferase [Microbacterium paludicola]
MDIRIDDLSGADTRALIAHHHAQMHAQTPAESVHALDIDALRDPGITVWSAWLDGRVAGVAALTQLDAERGELKSFRTADEYLGRGVARALLRRIIADARGRGLTSLWLETGSDDGFVPARALYASEGFVECGPFGGYIDDPLSTFMTRAL